MKQMGILHGLVRLWTTESQQQQCLARAAAA